MSRQVPPLMGLLLVAGCSWGHAERLAYDSLAREQIAREISAQAATIVAAADTSALAPAPDAEIAVPVSRLAVVTDAARQIEELAAGDGKRARVVQLYYAAPQDLEVEIGSPKDETEITAMAGLAVERNCRRGWWGRRFKALAEGVAAFGATFAGTVVTTTIEAFVPRWMVWLLALLSLAAAVIALYALYQRLVVLPRRTAALQDRERVIAEQEAALDEYDDAIEMRPWNERLDMGRNRPHLQRAHIPRNQRRKDRATGNPIDGGRSPLTCPTAREMLPGLNGDNAGGVGAADAHGEAG